jgi:hypothetical protein
VRRARLQSVDVAVNRSVPMKVFATVADAERWLQGLPPA